MIVKQSTRIILAEKRKEEHLEGELLSRYSISYKGKEDDHPTRPFGSLHLFKETTLGAGKIERLVFDEDMQLLILPLVGRVRVQNAKKQNQADIGEVLLTSIESGKPCNIFNDFENSEVHYAMAGFVSSESVEGLVSFSFTSDKQDTLFEEVSLLGLVKATIGQWKGRSEGDLVPTTPNTFSWVVQGAFEIQNCLLQKSDSLAIFGSEKIEYEALSNDAIIIFLEMT